MEEYFLILENEIVVSKADTFSEAIDRFYDKRPVGMSLKINGIINKKSVDTALFLLKQRELKLKH